MIGITISLGCLVLALTGIEWLPLSRALRQADWRYLLPAGVALLASLLTRAVRWRILLGPKVSLLTSFAIINIGYLVSNVLPFRLGDPARAAATGLRSEVKISAALSTVVVERVMDMLMVVLLLSMTLPFVGQAGWTARAGLLGGAAAVISLAVLILLAWQPDWGHRIARWLLARIPRLNQERWLKMADGLLEGLSALRSARRVTGVLIWSVAVWASIVGYYFAILGAFLDRPALVEGAFLACATGLGVALPSSPGAMGVFHSVARYALQLPFGVPVEEAVSVAFTAHAFQYVILCLLGLVGLLQQNLSLIRLQTDAATLARE